MTAVFDKSVWFGGRLVCSGLHLSYWGIYKNAQTLDKVGNSG